MIFKKDEWCNKMIGELQLSKTALIAMVIRGDENIILENDIGVIYQAVI